MLKNADEIASDSSQTVIISPTNRGVTEETEIAKKRRKIAKISEMS